MCCGYLYVSATFMLWLPLCPGYHYVTPTFMSCPFLAMATTLCYYFCAVGLLHGQCMLRTGLQANSNRPLHSLLFAVQSHTAAELGRSGEWDPTTKQGNPMHSMQIRNMLKGNCNHAAKLGNRQVGAMPSSENEMHRLLCHSCCWMFDLAMLT